MNKENFEERLNLDKEKIEYLSIINIDIEEYISRIEALEKDIEKKYKEIIDIYTSPLLELMIDNLYKNSLYRLKLIECDFLPYNDYLNTCLLVKNISISVNKNDLSVEELNELIDNIINILNTSSKLDSSTLNMIYSVCYKLMQLEINKTSTSRIIEYSKNNIGLRKYLKDRLEKDVLTSDKVSPNECDIAYECTSSLDDKIIKEEMVMDVTNDNIKDEVMAELKKFLEKISSNNLEMEKLSNTRKMNNPVAVTIVTYTSILAVAFTVVKVAHDNSTTHEYLTTKTTVTSTDSFESEKYMPKIKNGYQELVVESFPWSDLGNGTAVKKEISYDVTASDVNKDNYENSDLSNYKKETSVRKSASENFNISFNGDVERSFVTLTQDLTNERTRFDGLTFYIYMFLGSLCGIFTLLLAGGLYENASGQYIKDLIHEAHRRIKNGEVSTSEQEKINKYTKKYLKLMKENEEVKKRFMELYNKYLEILDLDELKNEYNRIMK